MPLDAESLESAIGDLVEIARENASLSDNDFLVVGSDYDIRADVLRDRFARLYPNGDVGPAPDTLTQRRQREVEQDVSRLLDLYRDLTTVIDRDVILDGKRHTLIFENRSQGFVVTYQHDTMQRRKITHAQWKKLKVERAEPRGKIS